MYALDNKPMNDTTLALTFPVSPAEIRATLSKLVVPDFTTPVGYDAGKRGIRQCVELRGKIEKRRKALKADSLEFGRLVDGAARELTAVVQEFEQPFAEAKAVVDEAKRLAEEQAQRELQERQDAEARMKREAEESKARAEHEAAAEGLRVEREKLDGERRQLETQRSAAEERQRVEREAIEAERRALAEERDRATRAEFERQTAIKAEAEAKAQAERDRVAAEEARVAEAERQAAHKARLDALKPDITRLREFAVVLRNVQQPELQSLEANQALLDAMRFVSRGVEVLEDFGAEQAAAE